MIFSETLRRIDFAHQAERRIDGQFAIIRETNDQHLSPRFDTAFQHFTVTEGQAENTLAGRKARLAVGLRRRLHVHLAVFRPFALLPLTAEPFD
jgi:hypothetical protein